MTRALITGASSGIGRALAERFALEGHDVVLTSRNRPKLLELAADLQARFGIRAEVIPADLSQPGAVAELMRLCPRIDFLVNNAGFGIHSPYLKTEFGRERDMLQVNLLAVLELTRALAPAMVEQGFGGILNVASTAAFQPGPYMSIYAAGKAFVLRFGEALREEIRNMGVTVTTLCPGPTVTGFNAVAGVKESWMVRVAMMGPERVALAGYRGLMRRRKVVIPGFWNGMGARLGDHAPRWLVLRTLGVLMRNGEAF